MRVVAPVPRPLPAGRHAAAGLVAVATRADGRRRRASTSPRTSASTWRRIGGLDVGITDVAWTSRGSAPELLVATDTGLYELPLLAGAAPNQVLVDPADPDRGFYDVEAFTNERGEWSVAVAAQAEHGVYLSTEAGQPGSFAMVGLAGVDTRTLTVQFDGPATWLWAGVGEADPTRPGQGRVPGPAVRGRRAVGAAWQTGWLGGTCWDIAFTGRHAFAATQNGGVVRLDLAGRRSRPGRPLDVNGGLPLRDRPRFEPVTAVATGTRRQRSCWPAARGASTAATATAAAGEPRPSARPTRW